MKKASDIEIKIEYARTTGRQRCTAKSKQTGEQCKNWAVEGKTKCRFHGGKTPPRTEEQKAKHRGNTYALKHGIYSNKLLTEEEKSFYYSKMEEWTKKYNLDEPNQLLLDRALRTYIKQARKDAYDLEKGEFTERGVVLDNESKFQKYMDMLGLSRKFNLQLKQDEKVVHDLASLLSGIGGGGDN